MIKTIYAFLYRRDCFSINGNAILESFLLMADRRTYTAWGLICHNGV